MHTVAITNGIFAHESNPRIRKRRREKDHLFQKQLSSFAKCVHVNANVKISQLNCQGFLSKLPTLHQLMIPEWKCDVALFSETWLRPTTATDMTLSLNSFVFFRRDRPHRTHGGVIVYVRDYLTVRRRPDLEQISVCWSYRCSKFPYPSVNVLIYDVFQK